MSGKQAKRRRQAERAAAVSRPPVRSVGSTGLRRPSPKVLTGAAAILALAIVAIVLAVVLTRGSSSSAKVPARGSLVNAVPAAAEVHNLLKGIPQSGNVLGSPSAPVTMVEYVDLQCPFCQQFETQVLPTLLTRYVRPGKVKIDARVIAFIGNDSVRGRKGALAAAEQNKFFDFTELLYANQGTENTGWLSDSMVEKTAASIPGLDVHALLDARNSDAVSSEAKKFDAYAKADNVHQTPTILVGKNAAVAHEVSSPDVRSVVAAIDAALR